MMDIEINAWSYLFANIYTNLALRLISIEIKDALFNFWKTGFKFLRISVVDGVIAIEL